MNLVVFGASGRTGRLVVEEARARGHHVTAVSRHPPAEAPAGVSWRRADVLDPEEVQGAVSAARAEAVIVCLGPGPDDDHCCGAGTSNIVSAARAAGIDRIACQTGAMIGHAPDRLGWVLRRLRQTFRASAPEQAADRDQQEEAVRRSGLRYTLVRPTRLTSGAATAALVAPDAFVPSLASSRRRDVAGVLVEAVEPDGRTDRGERELVVLSRPPLGATFLAAWVAAYAAGELIGLAVVGEAFAARPGGPWATALLAVAAGLFEGAVVGTLLGAVLGLFRPELSARRWLHATMAGAVVGWGLGSLPSLLLLADPASVAAERPAWMTIAGAAALGAVAGPVLAFFQARVLRVLGMPRAVWMAANAAGWAVAMPLVFRAAGQDWGTPAAALRGGALLAAAGAIVGVVTGLALRRAPAAHRAL